MTRSGDVKNQGEVHQVRKQKQGERETGTNLVKMPLDKAVIAITWGAHKGLAQLGG